VAELRRVNMIAATKDGELIDLVPGVGTDQIVKRLVELGMPVFEITPLEQTLEDFYLSLMKSDSTTLPPT
jgi:hypothetical protein